MSRDYKAEFEAAGGKVRKAREGETAKSIQRDFSPRHAATNHCGRELWVNDEGEPIFFG